MHTAPEYQLQVRYSMTPLQPQYYPNRGPIDITPGTFVYHGFGMGFLYLSRHRSVWCSGTQARCLCDRLDMEFRYVDSFSGYTPVYLGD